MAKTTHASELISPYGGSLVDLMVPVSEREELEERASRLASIQLSERSICDLELLATGGFSPIDRFMGREDLQRVLEDMRLSTGQLFPIPVTLPVDPAPEFQPGKQVALRNSRNQLLAVMDLEEAYEWDGNELATKVFGTQDRKHPLVAEMARWGRLNISGRLQVLDLPSHYDFPDLRLTPTETRARLDDTGYQNVVAFQTRNPMHRVHEELTKKAAAEVNGPLLLHPVVGMTKPGDVDHYTRVRTYKVMAQRYYDPSRILLSLLPLAMRFAGPREALWHAIIRRNYGANYLIIGRDHASPGTDSMGAPFYGPYDAQDMVTRFQDEIGVGVVPFRELVYLPEEKRYEDVSKVPAHGATVSISGTEVREEYLNKGRTLPDWFTRPEVAEILGDAYPARHEQGVCIWFTGPVGAGKTTTARPLTAMLMEHGRRVTLLDRDVVSTHLSEDKGSTRGEGNTLIHRIGFVASEIVRHGGVAVCVTPSRPKAARDEVRDMVGKDRFVEVFVNTPLDVCQARDSVGIHARVRDERSTVIDEPYEPPDNAEIELDTIEHTPEENATRILDWLGTVGFVRREGP